MTKDIFELLKEKEQENKKEKNFYVYYDPASGEIIHFRNYLEHDSYPFITVLESELGISLKNFRSKDYRVLEKKKKLTLVKVDNDTINLFNVNDLIYQIPKIDLKNRKQIRNNYDIIIEQNNKDQVFRLKCSSKIKEIFRFKQNLEQLNLSIYVTSENDPHILHQTLEFTIQDLLNYEYYTIKFNNFNGETCNLFSRKYFQTYLHVEIK